MDNCLHVLSTTDFWEVLVLFRSKVGLLELDMGDDPFAEVHDRSLGRDIEL